MKQSSEEKCTTYFDELIRRLQRENIEVGVSEDDRLPILLDGGEVGIVTTSGGMRVRKDSLNDPKSGDIYHRTSEIAAEVYEYMELMQNASPLKASSLSEPYKQLADFNGYVLGGMETEHGVQFTTWEWTHDKSGLTLGHYCGNDYATAKRDFTVRTGLVQEEKQFSPEQLIDIYRCCADTLTNDYQLTYEQEKRIEGIQTQIAEMVPDHVERFKRALEQDASSLQMQQTM